MNGDERKTQDKQVKQCTAEFMAQQERLNSSLPTIGMDHGSVCNPGDADANPTNTEVGKR